MLALITYCVPGTLPLLENKLSRHASLLFSSYHIGCCPWKWLWKWARTKQAVWHNKNNHRPGFWKSNQKCAPLFLVKFIFDPTFNLVLTQRVCRWLSPPAPKHPDLKPVWYVVKTRVYALVLQVLIREEVSVSGGVYSKPWNGAYTSSIYLRIRPWLWEAFAALVADWLGTRTSVSQHRRESSLIVVHYLAATDAKLPLTIRSHTQLELCLGEESPRLSAIYKLVIEEIALLSPTTNFCLVKLTFAALCLR